MGLGYQGAEEKIATLIIPPNKRMIDDTLKNPHKRVSLFERKKLEEAVKVVDIFGKRFGRGWFAVWIREGKLYTAHPVKDWNKFIEGLGKLGKLVW